MKRIFFILVISIIIAYVDNKDLPSHGNTLMFVYNLFILRL